MIGSLATAALAAELIGGATLVFAGAAKLAAPTTTRSALAALGAPHGAFVTWLAIVEIAAGVTLIVMPSHLLVFGLVAFLGLGFAATGAAALVRHLDVECGCYGPATPGRLGWAQIVMLPGWLAIAAMAAADTTPVLGDERTILLLGVLLGLTVTSGVAHVRLAREHAVLVSLREVR